MLTQTYSDYDYSVIKGLFNPVGDTVFERIVDLQHTGEAKKTYGMLVCKETAASLAMFVTGNPELPDTIFGIPVLIDDGVEWNMVWVFDDPNDWAEYLKARG